MDIIQIIDDWANVTPEHPAHICGDHSVTYAQLSKDSDTLASYLISTIPRDLDKSPIAVVGNKEPEMVIAFLGCIKAGHPYVPIDSTLPVQRIESIVSTAGASLTLTPGLVGDVLDRSVDFPKVARRLMTPDDAFYIIFTSGSTGTPKGVVITLGCLNSFMDWMLNEHPLDERSETFLGLVSFSFDVSIMDLYMCLVSGGTHISITNDDVANLAQLYRLLKDSGATFWISTPSFTQMCLTLRGFNSGMLPRLRRIVLVGEVLTAELSSELLSRFPQAQLWNAYGPTEATVLATSIRIDQAILDQYSSIPIGYPKPGSHVLVVGEGGRALPEGERGEIVIVGDHVSPGYLGRPDLTAKAFFFLDGQRAYHTGDWGRYRDGLLFFEGRRDFQIKLHGYRIELGDIEVNLRSLQGIRDAVVLPILRNGIPERLAAFVIMSSRPDGTDFQITQNLRNQLKERIPTYMIPQVIRLVSSFPMTVNGKADRKKLMELLG